MARGSLGGKRKSPASRGRPRGWAETSLAIHDPQRAARVLCKAVSRTDARLEWDKASGALKSGFWLKRTKKRVRRCLKYGWSISVELGVSTSVLLAGVAEEWGMSYSTLHRLTHGTVERVSWRTVLALQRRMDPAEYEQLERALVTPESHRLVRWYAAYIKRENKRLSARRRGKHNILATKWEAAEWKRFRLRAQNLGLPAPRCRLAMLRVYDPIIGWSRLRLRARSRERIFRLGFRRELELMKEEAAHLPRIRRFAQRAVDLVR